MSRRASEKSRRKRKQHPVALSPETKALLDKVVTKLGQNRNVFLTRLLVWFGERPEFVQNWILGVQSEQPEDYGLALKQLTTRIRAELEAAQQDEVG